MAGKRAREDLMEQSEKCDERFCANYTRLLALLIGCSGAVNTHLILAEAAKEKYTTRDDFALR